MFLRRALRRAVIAALPLGCVSGCGTTSNGAGDPPCKVAPGAAADAGAFVAGEVCAIQLHLELPVTECDATVFQNRDACAQACPATDSRGQALHGCEARANFLWCFYEVCATGRRPEGLLPIEPRGSGASAGETFARMAHLEAASIIAFERLANELARHGAPPDLIARARRAAGDEARHAKEMTSLATANGAHVVEVRVAPQAERDLERLALENAVEGCVRETLGAAQAQLQARAASDPRVRTTMRRIARDEAEHAALAWDMHAWFASCLDGATRARIDAALEHAVDELAKEIDASTPPVARRELGFATPNQTAVLFAALRRDVWSRPVA